MLEKTHIRLLEHQHSHGSEERAERNPKADVTECVIVNG